MTAQIKNNGGSQFDVVIDGSVAVTLDGAGISKGMNYLPAGTGAVATTVQGKLGESVSVKDFGAVGNGTTDDTAAIVAAVDYCGTTKALYIPTGRYKITEVISAACSIYGDSPKTSIIYNAGTGDGLNLNTAFYYSTFENFSIEGNTASRDGITLVNIAGSFGSGAPNAAYCHFNNVYSYKNGRHGLHHRMAWATRYNQCKFFENLGLGVYCNTQVGDLGTANSVMFLQCDSRTNGGTTSGFGSDSGGVKIIGAAGVSWIGGVVESNNGFGFYIGNTSYAVRNVHISDVYMEFNGWGVALGASFYIFGAWANVVIENCWLAFGAQAGHTHHLFNVTASTDNGHFVERGNTFTDTSTGGTTIRHTGTQFSQLNNLNKNTTPTFRAYQNATVSVPNATATKLPFNTENFDSNANYDSVTNYRFTPQCPGYYQTQAVANYFPATGTNGFISIYKNGAEWGRGQALTVSGATSMNVMDIVYLNGSTDYIEIFVFQSSGATQSYTPGAGLAYFSSCQIR